MLGEKGRRTGLPPGGWSVAGILILGERGEDI